MGQLGHIGGVAVVGGDEPPRRQGRQEGAEGLNRQDAEVAKAGAWAALGASLRLCPWAPVVRNGGAGASAVVPTRTPLMACRSTSPAISDPGQERQRPEPDPDPGSGGGRVRIGGPGHRLSVDIMLAADRPANPDDGAPRHDPMPPSPEALPSAPSWRPWRLGGSIPWRPLGDPGVLAVQPSGSERANHAANTRLQHRHMKVDQEPERLSRGFQVRDHLSHMERKQLRNCLQLHDQTIGHEQIQTRLSDRVRPVLDCHRDLPRERHLLVVQLHTKSLLVDGLNETRTEHAMHLDGRPDDLTGDRVDLLAWLHDSFVHTDSSGDAEGSFSYPGMGGAVGDGTDYGAPSNRRKPCPPFADTSTAEEWRSQCVMQ
jgi:hypothetical protein